MKLLTQYGIAGEPYTLILAMDGPVAISSDGTFSVQARPSFDFLIESIAGAAFIPSAVAGAIQALTAYPRQSAAQVPLATGANLIPTVDAFELSLDTNGVQWHNQPQRWSTVCGTGENPKFLTTPRLIPAGATITARLFNRSAIAGFTVSGELAFDGVLIKPGSLNPR